MGQSSKGQERQSAVAAEAAELLSKVKMPSSRWTWTRPTTHIYSYNREAQNIMSSRSVRATSVAANESRSALTSTSESNVRSSRAASVAASSDSFTGYSGYYGRQMALIMQKQGPTAAAAAVPISESLRAGSPAPTVYPRKAIATASASSASSASSAAVSRSTAVSTTTTTTESKLSREQVLKAQSESIEYGKRSKSQALRRAEMHAVSSGKDPRHTVLPRSLGDDICKVVADLHISPYESKEVNAAKASYAQGRLKVDRMEKQLQHLTDSAMSYKSIYAKSAAQMAREAMEACEQEAASSKKVRRTVVEESSRRVAAA